MTDNPKRLGTVVAQVLAYRGARSPEQFEAEWRRLYPVEDVPVRGATIRRIINSKWSPASGEDASLTLRRLAGMLRLPPGALILVAAGDVDAFKKLRPAGDFTAALRDDIVQNMTQLSDVKGDNKPVRGRRRAG